MIPQFLHRIVLAGILALGSTMASAAPAMNTASISQSLLHALDYLAVDYPQVVIHGEIINASEYAEQREFASQAKALMFMLPQHSDKAQLENSVQNLVTLIENRASGVEVQALCRSLSSAVISTYNVSVAPVTAPSLQTGAALYADNCAQCHGAAGYGDGPRACARV